MRACVRVCVHLCVKVIQRTDIRVGNDQLAISLVLKHDSLLAAGHDLNGRQNKVVNKSRGGHAENIDVQKFTVQIE